MGLVYVIVWYQKIIFWYRKYEFAISEIIFWYRDIWSKCLVILIPHMLLHITHTNVTGITGSIITVESHYHFSRSVYNRERMWWTTGCVLVKFDTYLSSVCYMQYPVMLGRFITNVLNSLWPSDVTQGRRTWSTLVQVVFSACPAISHYLIQCQLIVS